jgi:hypothetical protein
MEVWTDSVNQCEREMNSRVSITVNSRWILKDCDTCVVAMEYVDLSKEV